MKKVLGVLAALTMVGAAGFSAVACSSSTDPVAAPGDTGVKVDGATDTKVNPDVSKVDGGGDTGTPANKTTGKKCTAATGDEDCDPLGLTTSVCTSGAFGGSSLYPTNVCIQTECDPGDGTKIEGCDGDTGVCLSTGMGGICLPVCEFKDSADKPTGCEGNNACNVYGWGKDTTTMATIGVGYCFAGCKADADCSDGQKCQKEEGTCVKAVIAYSKTVGTACTDADQKAPAKCNCIYTTADKAGYCSHFCRVGETGFCGTGFSCDSGLPKTKLRDDDTVFAAAPAGMAGSCLKNCTSDADCTGLNAHCDENAGMAGQKTCQIGKRRCATTANCPTGQMCTGATATALGTCG